MGTFTGEKDSRNIVKKAKSGYYTRPNIHKSIKSKPATREEAKQSLGAVFQRENSEGKYSRRSDTSRHFPAMSEVLSAGMQTVRNNINAFENPSPSKGYSFNIQNKEINKIGQIPKVDLIGGKTDYKTINQRYKANGIDFFKNHYAGEGLEVADYLHDMRFGMNNASALKGEAYKGKIKSTEDIPKVDRSTGEFGKAIDLVDRYYKGEFFHFDSEEEYKKWKKESDAWTAKYGDGKTFTTTAPPIGKTKDGQQIDSKEWENAFRLYQARVRSDKLLEKRNDTINAMTADYSDNNAVNSIADVLVDSSQKTKELNKGLAGMRYGGVEFGSMPKNKYNLLSQFWQYNNDYVFKPLISGQYKTLLNNVLVNLGETLDLTAKGYKGFVYGTQGIYGKKNGMTQLDDGKTQWVYTGGSKLSAVERKAVQKRLINLGFLDYINGSSGSRLGGFNFGEKKKSINTFLSEVGVGEKERKELLREAKYFLKSFQKYKEGSTSAGSLKGFTKAYGTKKHYDVDTGNVGADMVLEMVSDPTILLSGASSVGKSTLKGTVSSAVREELENTLKHLDDAAVFDKTLRKNTVVDKYTKEYGKLFSDDLMYKSAKTLHQDVNLFKEDLIRRNIVDPIQGQGLQVALEKSLNDSIDSLQFKVVKSLSVLDNITDQIDKAFLKTVFGVPYVTVRFGIKPVAHKIRMNSIEGRYKTRRAVGRIRKFAENQDTHNLDIFSLEKVEERKVAEPVMEDVNAARKVDQEIYTHTGDVISGLSDVVSKNTRPGSLMLELDNYVFRNYGGQCKTFDEFYDYLKESPISDKNDVRDLFNALDQVKNRASDVVSKGRIDFNNNIIYNLRAEPFEDSRHYVESFEENFNNSFNLVQNRYLKEQLNTLYMQSHMIDDFDEREIFIKASLERIDKDYNSKNPFYGKSLVGKVEDNFDDSTKAIKNKVMMPEYGKRTDSLGIVSDKFFKRFFESKYKPDAFKRLTNFFESGKSVDELTQVEMQSMLREGIETIEKSIFLKEHLRVPLSKTDKYNLETAFLARDLERQLRFYNEANIVLEAERSFSQVHEDTAHALFRVIQNTTFNNVFSFATSKTLFGRYSTLLNNTFVEVLGIDVQRLSLPKEQEEVLKQIIRGTKLISSIADRTNNFVNFKHLVDSLSNNNVGLSSEKQIAIIETLFGSQSKMASNYYNTEGVYMDNFINRINAYMMARHGDERVALDSFRNQITDFNGDLWQGLRKRYGDAIDDEKVRERVINLCKGGHLNPSDDVRVTILQSIVRDNKFISDMNEYSKVQPVFITDIETMGLSADRSDVTAISSFRWTGVDDGDINKILDYIEDTDNIKEFHSYMPEEYIRKEMSPETLEQLYKLNPQLKSYHERIEDYIKHYGAEANNTAPVLEYDILLEWIKELDNAAAKMKDAVPKLVIHNTNNFDLDFIYKRCSEPEYQVYLQHINSWNDVDRESLNVLARIVGLQGDFMLTGNQARYVRQLVSEYASKVPEGGLMRPFEFKKVYQDTQELIGILSKVQDVDSIKNNASKSLSELPNDAKTINDMLADADLLKEIKFLQDDLKRIGKELYDKDNLEYTYVYNKFMDNPFDDYHHNNIMREINAECETELLQFGVDNVYDSRKAMRFFNIAGEELIYTDLKRMSNFSQAIIYDSTTRMIRNEIVHQDITRSLCNGIVDACKDIVNKFDYYDEMYYLRYLIKPKDDYELFALAKKLYDLFSVAKSERASSIMSKMGMEALDADFSGASLNPKTVGFNSLTKFERDYIYKWKHYCWQFNDSLKYVISAADRKMFLQAVEEQGTNFKPFQDWLSSEKAEEYYELTSDIIWEDFRDDPESMLKEYVDLYIHGIPDKKNPFIRRYMSPLFVKDADLVNMFEHANVLHDIYRDAPMDVGIKYFTAPTEDAIFYKQIADSIANKSMNLNAVEKSSISKTLTENHNTKIALHNNIMHEATSLFRELGALEDMEGEAARRCLSEGNKLLFRNIRDAYDIQILDYISQSEDNLISHLLHNNQILVVPFAGRELHKKLVNDLREVLKNVDENKIKSFEKNGYLFISIDKRWEKSIQIENDSMTKLGAPIMYFGDNSKGYLPPQYKQLGIDRKKYVRSVFDAADKVIVDMYKAGKDISLDSKELVFENIRSVIADVLAYREHFDQHMANLTGGKSIGSLGFLHDERTQREIWDNLPEEFKRDIVSVEFATNDRFFHNPSCQMSLLGDADNCWHVGAVDVDETDVFYGTHDTLRRTADRVSVEALAIDSLFSEVNPLNINTVFSGLDSKEVVNSLRDNPDVAVLVMVNAKTDTGYKVERLDIRNKADLEAAKRMNAVVYSYKEYLDIYEALNANTQDGMFWKWWARLANMHKVVALIKPMTAVRNALDAYCKGTIETGDPIGYAANMVKATKLIRAYNKVNDIIFKERGLYHATMKDIEANWDNLIRREGKSDIKLDFETYRMLDGWLSSGRSGGESKQLLEIKKKAKRKSDWKHVTKSKESGRDIITSDLEKFKQLSFDSAGNIYDKVLSDSEKQILNRETFLAIHSGAVNVPTVQITKYERLVDSIVQNFKNDKLSFDSAKDSLEIVYQNVNNGALKLMSAPEEIVRLGQYLTLADQGFSESAIHRNIVMSQYDTSVKSQAEKIIETIIPFFSFTKANIFYWAGLIDRNPQAFRMLEHIFSQFSWNFDNFDIDTHYDREQMLNGNINAEVINELIPDSIFGEKELDGWFRLQPSFMDAFNFAWGPVKNLAESLYSPLKGAFGEAYFTSGMDLKAVLGSDFMDGWDNKTIKTKVADSMPVYSIAKKYIDNPLSLIDTGLKFNKKDFEMNSFQIFLQNLEEHGKWYDQNIGKVVDLNEKNDYGLNAKGLDWDMVCHYNLLFHNKLFDCNQGTFVSPDKFRIGGLNRDWDFSKEGEWDEFTKTFYKYRGKKWDANQKAFVDPKDYISGGLNKKWDFNIPGEWDKFCETRKKFFPNEIWDANQGKFVLKQNYIKGGLNSKDLTWSQVCALKDALFGETWDHKKHQWVQTHKPTVKVDAEEYERHEADFLNLMSKVEPEKHDEGFLDRFIDKVYAAPEYNVLTNMSTFYANLKTNGSSNLTGNPENDAKVLAGILANASKFEKEWGRGWDYYSGKADGVIYRGKSFLPRKSGFVSSYYKTKGYAPKAYPKYSDPFSFNNNNTGLRNATIGKPIYDTYYNFEYRKLYNYKGSKDLLAHYPLRNNSSNRANNAYRVNTYYQGIYGAGHYKGLDRTVKNNVRMQHKLRMYQH